MCPGTGSTWIVGLHGRGSERAPFLRLLNQISHLEYPMLIVTYRTDPGAPSTDGSLLLAGQEEWPDVQAAVEFALASGAEDVVLAGPSMGRALSLAYTLDTDATAVRGLILEAPVADLREIVRLRSGEALPVGG